MEIVNLGNHYISDFIKNESDYENIQKIYHGFLIKIIYII